LLAEVLKKRGLAAKALAPEAISAGHIASLAGTEAKLVCLCYLGAGTGPAHIRYLVRRLRRILPAGTAILVAYFTEDGGLNAVKELSATAEADAYATSLHEAAEISTTAAKGELKIDEAGDAAAPTTLRDRGDEAGEAPAPTAVRDSRKVHAPADPAPIADVATLPAVASKPASSAPPRKRTRAR
jgi:hypothetical protein